MWHLLVRMMHRKLCDIKKKIRLLFTLLLNMAILCVHGNFAIAQKLPTIPAHFWRWLSSHEGPDTLHNYMHLHNCNTIGREVLVLPTHCSTTHKLYKIPKKKIVYIDCFILILQNLNANPIRTCK